MGNGGRFRVVRGKWEKREEKKKEKRKKNKNNNNDNNNKLFINSKK